MKLIVTALFLALAGIPFIYYLIALYSIWAYFRQARHTSAGASDFTPPVSNLKPIRGLDPGAYENFASFCRQDYPDYELVFCVGSHDDPVLPVIEKLIHDFPERRIRVLFGSGRVATNDKVAKLARLVSEAAHEVVVLSDSDVRVAPDFLRNTIPPLLDPQAGLVTCMYRGIPASDFWSWLEALGLSVEMSSGDGCRHGGGHALCSRSGDVGSPRCD